MAQSLGPPAGELWIGQPLELTVPARFQSADSRDTCVHAEVAYGEAPLAPARVRTSVLGDGEHRRVRITSDRVVDEPLVTLTLRAGCGSTVTRSYTLLPDMPSEAVLARLMQSTRTVARAAPAAPATRRVPARADARPDGLRLTPAVARVSPAAPPLRNAKVFVPARTSAALPRLRLDAIEADARSLLRASASLSRPGDAAVRARAAMLWRAISADPQDLVRGNVALQQLENELAQLRRAAGSTRAEVASLRQRIDEAQPWFLSPRAVQALALLVLAAAGAVALFARRERRAAAAVPWYAPGDAAASPAGVPASVAAQRAEAPFASPAHGQRRAPAAPVAPSFAPPALQPPGFELGVGGQPRARPASSGLLRVETLAATLEEVEFLATLGLHPDAMDVLEGYLEGSTSPSPVAFFELMRVCSLADDPQAVEAVRRRYAEVHGEAAPTLAQVGAEGGLEQQPALAGRVMRAWGSADVLAVIEHALFDVPAPGAPLPVQAARDLICLYDLAALMASAAHAPREEPLAPWARAEHPGEAQAFAQAVAEDVGGHRFALDIDLSVVPRALPEQPPEPDAQEIAARMRAERETARKAAERAAREAEEAFNAAVASERAPLGRC